MKLENNISYLTEIGFIKVGSWILKDNKLTFVVNNEYLFESDLLYAFESNGTVKYIGKTDVDLKSRMSNYKSGKENTKSGKTNKKVHKHIKNIIIENGLVNIYALFNKHKLDYKGYKISLASGIELSLIYAFDPNWNSRGTKKPVIKKAIRDTTSNRDFNTKKNSSGSDTFKFKLGKEYYDKGKIPIPVNFKDLVPQASGKNVNIQLGDSGNCSGTFTISGNTRSINGKKNLKEWFNANFKLNDSISVKIESETTFHLSK